MCEIEWCQSYDNFGYFHPAQIIRKKKCDAAGTLKFFEVKNNFVFGL
jgi:hypothetical protein